MHFGDVSKINGPETKLAKPIGIRQFKQILKELPPPPLDPHARSVQKSSRLLLYSYLEKGCRKKRARDNPER